MPAPPLPSEAEELDLDPQDLVAEPEERTTSQTRRLGSNAQARLELEIKDRGSKASMPSIPDLVPLDELPEVDSEPPTVRAPGITGEVAPLPPEPPKPVSKPYLAGDVIDQKYKLTRIIGRGGMGAVWQAHNIPLDIDVAIKLIRRDRTAPGAADRLLTEARAAARLMHPAIVRVFDFGETDQADPFIVMELLRGESLSAILRRKKRLSPTVAVQTLLPVAAALASAHGKGIVHRDLKPDNIIVITDENGALVPKIVDFGIAKLLQAGPADRNITMAGEVLGSPDYMSPEQARGAENVGEATDVWAFTVVLYELVTGKRPFDGPNYNSLIASILTDDPKPIGAHGVTDTALAGIIEHGLAKDTATRWPRIRDMGAALASWAIANGVEDDLTGNPLRKQWLGGATRRLLTVQPETGGPTIKSTPVEAPSPWVSLAPPAPQAGARPAAAATEARASARRAVLLIVSMMALGASGVTAFLLLRDRIAMLRAPTEPTASASAPLPTTSASAPASAATEAPTTSASAEAPPPPPVPTVSAHVLRPLRTNKGKAPPAPKNIKF